MKQLISFLLFIPFCFSAYGQVSDSTKTVDTIVVSRKYSKLKIELDYTSDNSFIGRKNIIRTPLFSPLLKYTNKSGFFIQTSAVSNTKNRSKQLFDELDAGAGWGFDFSQALDGSASYHHYFYGSGVSRLKSSIQNNINLSANFDWNILYSRLLVDYYEGTIKAAKGKNKTKTSKDYNITLVNMHDFNIKLTKNSKLQISPEVDVLFGTQNYLAINRGKVDTTRYKKQASAFNLTSYILYLDVRYKVKNLSVLLSPSYTIPKNTPSGESSTPYFITSISIYYIFKFNNRK